VKLHQIWIRSLCAGLALTLAALSPLPRPAQSGSTPLFFEVRSESGTAYLFGTLHVGSRRLYPLPPQIENAFAAADALVLEANPLDQAQVVAALARGTYQPPDTLAQHIPPALFQEVKKVAPKVGLPVEYARSLKPHLLAMTLAMMEIQRLGYDASAGLDVYFARRAGQIAKPVLELESMDEQIELFDSLPADAQAGLLRMALDGITDGTMGVELETLVAAWINGDADTLHASVLRETEGLPQAIASELNARIYERRNETMASKVAAMLEGRQVVFVAVGAGHLTGATGIPARLKARGLLVRRL